VRVAVELGSFRLLGTIEDGRSILLRGTVGSYDGALTTVFRGPLVALARPAWNGRDTIMAGQNGFEVFLGAFVLDGTSPAWRSFGPVADVEAAAQAASGETQLLYRADDGSLRLERFDAEGAMLGGPLVLEDVGLLGRVAFGRLEDGTSQPYVLAGFSPGDGELRPTLRRFRTDGSAAGGFSAPSRGAMSGGIDLSTVAPRGHTSGYGMVAGLVEVGAIFHGAGEDFVGDSRPVPVPCDGVSVSIASGPCGYVIACSDGELVQLALAVPPLPR
jgi:hypothetical protein